MIERERWSVWLRGRDFSWSARLVAFEELAFSLAFNDEGRYSLTLPIGSPQAGQLGLGGGYGIIVTRDDAVVFSGSHETIRETLTGLVVEGIDDTAELASLLADPDPGASQPTTPYDVRTAPAETIMRQYVEANTGPTAPRVEFRMPGLQSATTDDLARGLVITGRARYQTLLYLLQELALVGGGLGFRIRQGAGGRTFEVYAPEDRSGTIVFSAENRTLGEYEHVRSRPTASFVTAAGAEPDIEARTIYEQADDSAAAFGVRRAFLNVQNADSLADIVQRATEALAAGAAGEAVTLTALDRPGVHFGEDYGLGDIVTATTRDGSVQAVVRRVDVRMTAEGIEITPTLGTTGADSPDADATTRQMVGIGKRLSEVERNWRVPDNSITPDMLTTLLQQALPSPGRTVRICAAATPSPGWLLAQGQAVSRTTYAAMFANIGTTYGAGDGSTTFNLPDLRGRFPMGVGGAHALGATGGAEAANLQHQHTGPPHTHSHSHTGAAHTHPGSHSHGVSAVGIAHTHTGAAHTHPGSHSHGPGTLNIAHTHDVDINHDHAVFSSGGVNVDTVAVGSAAYGSGTTDHHHQIDVPALGSTGKTTVNLAVTSRGGSTDTDSNAPAASYSGQSGPASAGATGTTDPDSNAPAASYSAPTGTDVTAALFSDLTGAAGSATQSILNPHLVVNFEIYTGIAV